jgi:flavodoxin
MQIGIIVYSQTGNTLSVAEKLAQALTSKGHSVNIAKVETESETKPATKASELKSAPDVSPYDAIIFASPVQAFSLAPSMKVYLANISSLTGKQVYCFVTQHLRYAWMGGNRAIRAISAVCKQKGAQVKKSGIVHWSDKARDQQIEAVVRSLSEI